jgi:hypothetical protein
VLKPVGFKNEYVLLEIHRYFAAARGIVAPNDVVTTGATLAATDDAFLARISSVATVEDVSSKPA